jgi:hypothetical protein
VVEWKARAVLFDVPEVSTWNSLTGRTGATIVGEVLKGFAGEALGFQNADDTKTNPVPANEYRMGLIIGAQPGMAGPLLANVESGLPQRIIFMPTWHDERPDLDSLPAMPDPWMWSPPAFDKAGYVVQVWEGARRQMLERRYEQLASGYAGDPMDSHELLVRLRLAVTFSLMGDDRPGVVTEEDWELAGLQMHVSKRTREDLVQHLRDKNRRENLVRAQLEGERRVRVDEVVADADVERVKRWVSRKLNRAGDWVAGSDLKSSARSTDRALIGVALASLISDKRVQRERVEYHGQPGWRFRMAS